MPTLFRKTAQLLGELRLAASYRVTHTLRVLVNSSPKSSGKVTLTNVRAEFIESIPMPVTSGSDVGTDVVSIRTVVSGSTQSEAAIIAAVTQHQANVAAALADGAMKGFVPTIDFVAKP